MTLACRRHADPRQLTVVAEVPAPELTRRSSVA
jgi:hypothetical protein